MTRSNWFWLAALAGGAHAAISLYWALGGTGLLWTMGESFADGFASRMWLLYPVALVKFAVAIGPLWLQSRAWRPWPRLTRLASWLAAVTLIGWGGLTTVIGNLVLASVIEPVGGYDRGAMIGHAWLWDPLFAVWGVALLVGLARTRRR
ncbi:DUF3995 domain-containing protein [Corynebacterium hansenii]|uniref:DUF3995 domain-containing protein n=1 Tax=Corynebacterium hansenii TaxID=394964 RepID=A0ABV7ZMI3_9CORY|nr:DUF3995 domain-containing protein [Corynebacterium hansenii]WJY99226.1 hypothetical protein CHAN_02985 [Corynebacterium hansenii]